MNSSITTFPIYRTPTSTEETTEMNPSISIQKTNKIRRNATNIPIPPPLLLPPLKDFNIKLQPPQNLSRATLIATRQDYFSLCVPLYKASVTGDWEAAKLIFDKRPELVRVAITDEYDTVLHVAALAEENKFTKRFVKNLVNLMTMEDLELKNQNQYTALCLASAAGNIKMVMTMVDKNPNLLNIPGKEKMMPLYFSAFYGKYNTVKYLYDKSLKMTGNFWTPENRARILLRCVECDFFDVALKIVTDLPELAGYGPLLETLARKPDTFNEVQQNSLIRIINSIFKFIHMKTGPAAKEDPHAFNFLTIVLSNTIKAMSKSEIDKISLKGRPLVQKRSDGSISFLADEKLLHYSSRILFVAAEMGNTRFVVELLRSYPDLIWRANDDNHTIFHIAIMHRHHGIYSLLYEIGSRKDLITDMQDGANNNMLHLVGMTSKKMRSHTPGASLQMQRELLWFKEVEKMVPASYKERKNKDGKTPYELFSEQNEDLVFQGLKWMKDCIVVATLIVTVAFAVAFTVPGGYNQEIGIPIFTHGTSFIVFVIADAISLFSSSTSLLVFLSMLTSRHGQRDFINSLPNKLMIGLVSLFISVAAMMVTFSASFFVLYHKGLKWIPLLIATFAVVPVIVFAVLQFPLLVDMFRSIYDSRYLFKPKKSMLYNLNPRF